ncbi:MAG: hypothetical protein LBK52_01200, partial [Deltaproteobacteria bacterium]|nr:hypothetical protein [Deltaproteobacteria bacterium]
MSLKGRTKPGPRRAGAFSGFRAGNFVRALGLVLLSLSLGSGAAAFGAEPAAPEPAYQDVSGRAADIREGDIIFQALNTPQSLALVLATGSEYTHCGLVFEEAGRLLVL